MKDATFWIKHLGLRPHPEGGYFGEVYRSGEQIAREALPERYSKAHAFATSIYPKFSNRKDLLLNRLRKSNHSTEAE